MKEEEEHYEVKDQVDWTDQPRKVVAAMKALWRKYRGDRHTKQNSWHG